MQGHCGAPSSPGPWGEGSSWRQAAEDRSRRVVLSSSGHDSGAGLAFPSSFRLHTLVIWNGTAVTTAVSLLAVPTLHHLFNDDVFSCLLSLALCTSSPTCLTSSAQSHLLRADPKICDRQPSNTLVNATREENYWLLHCLSSFLSFLTSWDLPRLSESWSHLKAAPECRKYKNKPALFLFLAWQCSKETKSEHL